MATTKTPAPRASGTKDAVALLKADHKKVSDLFEQYDKARAISRKKLLVSEICMELTVHAQLEEEIFYPAVQAAMKDHELVPEANVEHASVKELMAQVKDAEPGGDEFDAKIKVMSEYVKHHVKEEQNEMFPKAKATGIDMAALGKQMVLRKAELMGEVAG